MKVIVTKKNESVIYNGNIYSHGQSFDVDEVIGKSLMERGYVAADGAADAEKSLEDMSYPELKKLAAEMGLSATGKKEDLIARINGASEEDETEADDEEQESEEDETADDLPNTGMPE